jgi:hypothetical protein
MDTNPITCAEEIYSESLSALMAHSIRGVQNYFRKERLNLELRVVADVYDIMAFKSPDQGATSLLQVRHFEGSTSVMPRVEAMIFIHRHANKHLARICIAHEIYHLILELAAFVQSGRKEWNAIPSTKKIEDECNQFAWELCKRHDDFNRNGAKHSAQVFFPDKTFSSTLTTNLKFQELWPNGVGLDPQNTFHGQPEPSPDQAAITQRLLFLAEQAAEKKA